MHILVDYGPATYIGSDALTRMTCLEPSVQGTQHSIASCIRFSVTDSPLRFTHVGMEQATVTSEESMVLTWGWFQMVEHISQPIVDQPRFE